MGETLTYTHSLDADGEEPGVAITWPDGSTGPTYMVTAANDPSSTITCTATASDADGGSASNSANATVINTDPEIVAISVTPTTGAVGDLLTCAATATDADGGTGRYLCLVRVPAAVSTHPERRWQRGGVHSDN